MQSGVELKTVKMSMNPFCEIAVEVRHILCPTSMFNSILLARTYSILFHMWHS